MSRPPTYSSNCFDIRQKTQLGVLVYLNLTVPPILSLLVVGHGVLDSEVHGNKQCKGTKNTNGTGSSSQSSETLALEELSDSASVLLLFESRYGSIGSRYTRRERRRRCRVRPWFLADATTREKGRRRSTLGMKVRSMSNQRRLTSPHSTMLLMAWKGRR